MTTQAEALAELISRRDAGWLVDTLSGVTLLPFARFPELQNVIPLGVLDYLVRTAQAQRPPATPELYAAVKYLLDRAQVDPDLMYQIGALTESRRLLCAASAAHLGAPLEKVEAHRARDLQPAYRWREPEVLVLRRARDAYRELVDRDDLARADAELEVEGRAERERALARRSP